MADDTLLSDLCSICNTTKSKYRCPGCDARTCSLPCYKRHQQWAQCSGKRDPTKFIKKSQLATPAGIDHDFNFITSIERGLEKAERDVNDRLGPASDLRSRPRQHLSDNHFAAAGVHVVRAPKGLSRQRENKTRRSNQGNIVWTVEWIREDKSRVLSECPEGCPISESQPFERHRAAKKRKRATEDPPLTSTAEQHHASTEGQHVTIKAEDERRECPSARKASSEDSTQVEGLLHQSICLPGPDSESLLPEYHYFLLRPRTSSSKRVLIPIASSATLAECLHGRTVLEYPTIYAFPGPEPQLSHEFILDEDYVKQQGEEDKELGDLLKHVDPQTLRAIGEEQADDVAGEEVDSAQILDVLKRDLGVQGS